MLLVEYSATMDKTTGREVTCLNTGDRWSVTDHYMAETTKEFHSVDSKLVFAVNEQIE